jgi:hypothetical protein
MSIISSIGPTIAPTIATMLSFRVLDQYLEHNLRYHRPNHRWCVMHTALNFGVVILTARGLVTYLSSDTYIVQLTSMPDAGFNINSSVLVMGAHLYHLVFYNITDKSTLAHHYIMLGVLVIPYLNSGNQRFMAFADYSLFFLCGLPGMIDYACMHLTYTGQMKRIKEKQINNFLNTYIRAPGILYGAFLTYRMWVNDQLSSWCAFPVIASFVWNAQFFSNAVSFSYGYECGSIPA